MPKHSETANCAQKFKDDAIIRVIGLHHFTPIPTSLLQDNRLSWEERGMLCEFLSQNDKCEISTEFWNKLKTLGYISEDGEFAW